MESLFDSSLEQALTKLGVPVISEDKIEKLKPHIGEGGFGKVYKGNYDGNVVAIKKIKIEEPNMDILEEILNEIRVILHADHKSLPKFYGVWKNKKHYHLVFEFIKGPTLKAMYTEINKKEKLTIAHDMCEILEALHAKKLIHRDIKPANVMIEEGNRVRLIDFGISKIAQKTATFTKSQTGTIPYMSPELYDIDIEQYMNPDAQNVKPISISPKVDVWAIGCLLSEIFSGQSPWNTKNEFAITRKLTNKAEYPVPKDVDDDVKELIQQATKVDPAERPTAGEMKKLIEDKINSLK
jgi:serine/threonine protein kinase